MLRIGKKNIGSPAVMGILNITPDSFSDGGSHRNVSDAVTHALNMIDDGAIIIDIGAESTRPGFSHVSESEELSRLIPVIREIREVTDIIISVDTMKSSVAREAISAGADIINDVNAFRGDGMFECVAECSIPIVIMHSPFDMDIVHQNNMVGDPIPQIVEFFNERIRMAEEHGVRKKDMILDPGIGFGKTMDQNAEIIRRFSELRIGHPLLMALSRKRVLSYVYPGMDRDDATTLASLDAIRKGADIVRVHDVRRMVEAIHDQNMNL